MLALICFCISHLVSNRNYKRGGFALIKLGGGVADARGSVGGTVFSRNKYGAYTRNRTIPVNPSTPLQTKVRACMGQIRDAWQQTLTAAQRAAWAVYAANVEVTNRIGEAIKLTGWNMFSRTNTAVLYNGGTLIPDAPTTFTLAEQDAALVVTGAVTGQKVSVAFNNQLEWANEADAKMIVFASRPQNATVNSFKGPYQYAGSIAGNASTPPTSPALLNAPFALTAGQKVFVQCRILRADGRLSNPFRASGLVS